MVPIEYRTYVPRGYGLIGFIIISFLYEELAARARENHATTEYLQARYENMLTDVPELNNVFNHTNQLNGTQAAALAGSLYAYASHIHDLGTLSPTMARVSQKVGFLCRAV